MRNIPKVSAEAIEEAYKTLSNILATEDEDFVKKHFMTQKNKFETRQPEIGEFVQVMCDRHIEQLEGVLTIPHFCIYVMTLIDSFYIQNEMDDIKDLFNKEK